jgi:hypothetical protein
LSSATRGFQFESKSIAAAWNLSCVCPKVNSLAIESSNEGLLSIPYLVRSTEVLAGLLPEEEEKGIWLIHIILNIAGNSHIYNVIVC